MRAIAFFETSQLSESTMYAERWVDMLVDRCFESQKLERFALVSGVPSLTPEFTTVNFGTIEQPDMRQLIRVLFEVPDIPGEDILLMFAGQHIKELANKPAEAYTEQDQIYINVVSGCFGAIQHAFQTSEPQDTDFVSFLSVPNVEVSRQYAMTALLRDAKVEQAQQAYVASPELINKALEEGLPLPPGLAPEALEAAYELRQKVPFNVMAEAPAPGVDVPNQVRTEETPVAAVEEATSSPRGAVSTQTYLDESPYTSPSSSSSESSSTNSSAE